MSSVQLPVKDRPYEIRFESIGGLGAHAASQILAEAAVVSMDLNAAAFSSYGSEKKGTPVRSYVRLLPGDKPLRICSPIETPDVIVFFHPALLNNPATIAGLRADGTVIINGPPGEVPKQLEGLPKTAKIIRVDALKIAIETKSRPNAVLLGTLSSVAKFLDPKAILETLSSEFAGKHPEAVASNEKAFTRGATEFEEIKNPGKVSSDTRELASELLMLDSMRMIITDMLDKNPNPEEMDEESLRQLSTAWIRFKVIEWLDTGIKLSERFACHRCDVGECCTDSIVEIRPNEVEPMAAYLRMTPELFLKKFTYLSQEKPFLRAPCPFYKRGKKESRHPSCLIYPVRPLVCRIFPLTGLFIVRNVERCPMARDIVMALADVDTKSVDLSVLEKRIKPYIERSINDEKNLNPEEISDKLEEAMVERLPEDTKLMKSKSRQNMRVNPLVFRALLDRLMIRGKKVG